MHVTACASMKWMVLQMCGPSDARPVMAGPKEGLVKNAQAKQLMTANTLVVWTVECHTTRFNNTT